MHPKWGGGGRMGSDFFWNTPLAELITDCCCVLKTSAGFVVVFIFR